MKNWMLGVALALLMGCQSSPEWRLEIPLDEISNDVPRVYETRIYMGYDLVVKRMQFMPSVMNLVAADQRYYYYEPVVKPLNIPITFNALNYKRAVYEKGGFAVSRKDPMNVSYFCYTEEGERSIIFNWGDLWKEMHDLGGIATRDTPAVFEDCVGGKLKVRSCPSSYEELGIRVLTPQDSRWNLMLNPMSFAAYDMTYRLDIPDTMLNDHSVILRMAPMMFDSKWSKKSDSEFFKFFMEKGFVSNARNTVQKIKSKQRQHNGFSVLEYEVSSTDKGTMPYTQMYMRGLLIRSKQNPNTALDIFFSERGKRNIWDEKPYYKLGIKELYRFSEVIPSKKL